jgi:hypothetical protein
MCEIAPPGSPQVLSTPSLRLVGNEGKCQGSRDRCECGIDPYLEGRLIPAVAWKRPIDDLALHVALEAHDAMLTAEPGFLEPAERNVGFRPKMVIDPYGTGLDLCRDFGTLFDVGRPHRGTEAHRLLFARAIASSISLYFSTGRIGPNCSSVTSRASSAMSATIVGATKYPG